MKILAFFICIFFSTSVLAATYATCSANDWNNNKEISLKLTWNKVFVNEDNSGLEEWKTHIYTNEEIVISKVVQHKPYKCEMWCMIYWKIDTALQQESLEIAINSLKSKTPYQKKFEITIDRISGALSENTEYYVIDKNITNKPEIKKNFSRNEYTCQSSDKTKF